nr:response regulator [Pyxidicoccus fallax]
MLVDDDPDILDSIAAVLELDYEVAVALNGAEALKQLDGGGFDAVVLDMMMPVLDGAGFMAALRERGLQVPVLLVSAGRDLAARCRVLGASDYLPKPFDMGELEQRLARIIQDNAHARRSTQPEMGGRAPSWSRPPRME